jgi:hypothetical protein
MADGLVEPPRRIPATPPIVPAAPSPPKIAGVKPLSEPAVNRSKQFARVLYLALVAPEACEAHCGAEFPGFCLLLTRDGERTLKIRLYARLWIACLGMTGKLLTRDEARRK